MSNEISSTSPIDGETLWQGEAIGGAEVQSRMLRAEVALSGWRKTPIEERVALVRRYGEELKKSQEFLTQLISREIGKLTWDAAGEVAAAIAKVEISVQAMEQRRTSVATEVSPGKAGGVIRRIRYQPLGVTLALGPFNFPLHLPGGQIIPALLAGNTVVFKPSEQAVAVAQWMFEAWQRVGLPKDVLQMLPGGIETAAAAIEAPQLAAVFLTGGRTAGHAIHRQLAGRPSVLLALELGGNNPMVVTEFVDPQTVARLVSFSAFVSAGQRCTCARRALFVEGNHTDQQIEALVQQTQALRVGMPGANSVPHIGPVISSLASNSLRDTYQRLLDLGCEPLIPLHTDESRPQLVHPAIVDATHVDHGAMIQIGREEWFGPILVVQRVKDFDSAVVSAANTPYGLSAALLGGSREEFERFADEVEAGVVNWNAPTTGAAGVLPFGGLGESGNHRPAGFFAIDFCNDPIASLEHSEPNAANPWDVIG